MVGDCLARGPPNETPVSFPGAADATLHLVQAQLSTVVLERRKHDVTVTLDGYKAEVDE